MNEKIKVNYSVEIYRNGKVKKTAKAIIGYKQDGSFKDGHGLIVKTENGETYEITSRQIIALKEIKNGL